MCFWQINNKWLEPLSSNSYVDMFEEFQIVDVHIEDEAGCVIGYLTYKIAEKVKAIVAEKDSSGNISGCFGEKVKEKYGMLFVSDTEIKILVSHEKGYIKLTYDTDIVIARKGYNAFDIFDIYEDFTTQTSSLCKNSGNIVCYNDNGEKIFDVKGHSCEIVKLRVGDTDEFGYGYLIKSEEGITVIPYC